MKLTLRGLRSDTRAANGTFTDVRKAGSKGEGELDVPKHGGTKASMMRLAACRKGRPGQTVDLSLGYLPGWSFERTGAGPLTVRSIGSR